MKKSNNKNNKRKRNKNLKKDSDSDLDSDEQFLKAFLADGRKTRRTKTQTNPHKKNRKGTSSKAPKTQKKETKKTRSTPPTPNNNPITTTESTDSYNVRLSTLRSLFRSCNLTPKPEWTSEDEEELRDSVFDYNKKRSRDLLKGVHTERKWKGLLTEPQKSELLWYWNKVYKGDYEELLTHKLDCPGPGCNASIDLERRMIRKEINKKNSTKAKETQEEGWRVEHLFSKLEIKRILEKEKGSEIDIPKLAFWLYSRTDSDEYGASNICYICDPCEYRHRSMGLRSRLFVDHPLRKPVTFKLDPKKKTK